MTSIQPENEQSIVEPKAKQKTNAIDKVRDRHSGHIYLFTGSTSGSRYARLATTNSRFI